MPIELKEVVEFLGYKPDEFKDINDLKSKFETDFVRSTNITEDSEPVKKILGKTFGTLENEIKKVAKSYDLDIDMEAEELKGKKVTEKLKHVFSKYDEKKKSVIDDLSKKAGQGNDEKIKEWESKYEKLNKKYSETDDLLKRTSGEFETFKQSKDGEIKAIKRDTAKSKIYEGAKFIPEANEYTKKGFLNDFEQKYKLDFDEEEKKIVPYSQDGKRIPNPKVTGTFYEVSDLLQEELIKAKLFPMNKDGGKLKPGAPAIPVNTQNSATRPIAKRLGV